MLLAFQGPGGDSGAKAIPEAKQAAVIPDNPEMPEGRSQAAPPEAATPQGQSTPAIPSSSISLSREQRAAAQEMEIAPLDKETDTSQSADSGSPQVLPQGEEVNSSSCKWERTFLTTTYGPPWNSVEGGPETATGKALKAGKYYVAVDPSVIPLGSQMRIWPNPHNYRGLFTAEDTGGAIKGNKIDIFVWQGKSVRDSWKKNAKVCLVRSGR